MSTSHSDRFGWQPGFTRGASEGKWSRVDSGLMKYERAGTLTYGPPTSQEWRDGHARIFGEKQRAPDCEKCGEAAKFCKCPPSSSDS